MTDEHPARTAFEDLTDYVALARIDGLALSPDGTRLVTAVSTCSPDGKKYLSAIWELDPHGDALPRRLTRSAPGEGGPAFAPDGSVLFISRRPDPSDAESDDETAGLWLLPAGPGEAREILRRPGGVAGVAIARASGEVVVTAPILAGVDGVDDQQARSDRKDAGVSAILHESYPVRSWDHDLGPAVSHLLAAGVVPADGSNERAGAATASAGGPDDARGTPADEHAALDGRRLGDMRDLTPSPEGRFADDVAITDDGSLVVYGWSLDRVPGDRRQALVVADVATGERRLLIGDEGHEYSDPAWSPDGRSLACVRWTVETTSEPPEPTLVLVDVASGGQRELAPSLPLWPRGLAYSPDGAALFFIADERGHAPVFRLELGTGEVTRLAAAGAHSDIAVSPDGQMVYALRAGYTDPPHPVRLDAVIADQDGARLRAPGGVGPLPGTLVEVSTAADDGALIRAWLALPDGASADNPAPLVLWIHGGPLSSWNTWVVAVESVAAGIAWVRRAAARPGAVHRIRAGLHPARLGSAVG